MAIIGTSYDDPNFYSRKAQQLGQTIGNIRSRWEENRERQRQKEQAEIDRFFSAVTGMPELAGTWGEEIKQKYGEKYPGVSEMIDLVKNRYEAAGQAKSQWLGNWGQLQQGYQQQGQAIQGMPEAFSPVAPGTGPAMPFQVPNLPRMQAQQDFSKIQPGMFSRQAIEMLPPEQQLEVNRLIQDEKFAVPDPARQFDLYRDAPADFKVLAAAESGQFGPPDSTLAKAARVGYGMEQKPSTLQQQGYWTAERVAREGAKEKAITAAEETNKRAAQQRHDLQIARIKLQDSLARSRESNRFSHEKGLIDYRKSAAGEAASISPELIVRDSKAAAHDFDTQFTQIMKSDKGSTAKAADRIALLRQYGGRRPLPLNHGQARILAGEINAKIKSGELTESEAEEATVRATAEAMARMSKGEGPVQAVRNGVQSALAFRHQQAQPVAEAVAEPELEGIAEEPETEPIRIEEPGEVDIVELRSEAEAEIRQLHPEWTDDQVEDAVEAFLRSQG